jgi:formamidopyrimidine-DNA glycosylase
VPELPEVETVRRGLDRWVTGRTIAQVEVLHPRAVRRHLPGAAHFVDALAKRTVTGVRRRGKYLWLPLDDEDAIIGHLGMSGQLLMQPAEAPDELHLRVRVSFTDDGPELRFVDQRTFGGLAYSPGGAQLPTELAHIALDPVDPSFVDVQFVQALRRRRTQVKRALLDQTLVSGIGNIYADEALWRSRLHWARPTDTMTGPAVRTLLGHVRDVLVEAIGAGGTSFDALYVNVNGQSGYFDRALAVYGREGKPCPRCGTPVRREPFMNRSSFSCPKCQPRPRRV